MVGSASFNDVPLVGEIVKLMGRNRRVDMQLAAARCLTYLYRCGILQDNDERIVYKALPCLVNILKDLFSPPEPPIRFFL